MSDGLKLLPTFEVGADKSTGLGIHGDSRRSDIGTFPLAFLVRVVENENAEIEGLWEDVYDVIHDGPPFNAATSAVE